MNSSQDSQTLSKAVHLVVRVRYVDTDTKLQAQPLDRYRDDPLDIPREKIFCKMSRRAKVTLLLSVGTICNLFGYLYLTGSWKIFFTSSVPKNVYSENRLLHGQHIERDISQILHNAVNEHNLSKQNITNLVNTFLDSKFPSDEAEAGNKSSVKKNAVPLAVVDKPSEPKETKSEKQQAVGEKHAPKKEETNVLQEDEKLDASLQKQPLLTKVEGEPKKGPILSAINSFMKGKVERPVNPHDFNYMINEPEKCKNPDGSNKDVFLLVLICTVHKNFENRNAIRQSWGSPVDVDGHRIITMFLLAKQSDDKLQDLVMEENEQYHDIIMEDFVDTYKNLTLKTIMGMKWMATFCPHAKYMVKTDDDMYVSYKNIVNYLISSPDTRFVTGMVIKGAPIRDPKSKWYMPKDLYPDSKYPPFCSGTGYILSGDVPPQIYHTSLSTPYLYLEDVFVAICIEKLKIVPKNHREFHNWRTTYTFCHFKRILTAHMVTPTEMLRYWNDQNTNKHRC